MKQAITVMCGNGKHSLCGGVVKELRILPSGKVDFGGLSWPCPCQCHR